MAWTSSLPHSLLSDTVFNVPVYLNLVQFQFSDDLLEWLLKYNIAWKWLCKDEDGTLSYCL